MQREHHCVIKKNEGFVTGQPTWWKRSMDDILTPDQVMFINGLVMRILEKEEWLR